MPVSFPSVSWKTYFHTGACSSTSTDSMPWPAIPATSVTGPRTFRSCALPPVKRRCWPRSGSAFPTLRSARGSSSPSVRHGGDRWLPLVAGRIRTPACRRQDVDGPGQGGQDQSRRTTDRRQQEQRHPFSGSEGLGPEPHDRDGGDEGKQDQVDDDHLRFFAAVDNRGQDHDHCKACGGQWVRIGAMPVTAGRMSPMAPTLPWFR
jgi:hypothetical protein